MHAKTKTEWFVIRQQYLADLAASRGLRLALRDRVWAVTEENDWVALPGVTATTNPDQWWLGYLLQEFRDRRAVGAILLCASVDQPLLDFGLPAALIAEIEPHLSTGNQRAQLYFNLFRRGHRFELQLKGGRSLDITNRLGDVSWLRPGAAAKTPPVALAGTKQAVVAETKATYGGAGNRPPAEGDRFFARYSADGLQPLDPVDLESGTIYLVQARPMGAVPRSAALRRIAARGGPADLPSDLAEQHDHYAHGRPRR
jgi:hypothetical protein